MVGFFICLQLTFLRPFITLKEEFGWISPETLKRHLDLTATLL